MARFILAGLALFFLVAAWAAEAPSGPPLFARVTVLEVQDAVGPFDAVLRIPVIHRPPWYPGWTYRATGLTLNQPSDWLELVDVHPESDVVTVVVSLTAGGQPVKSAVRVRVELARSREAQPLAALEVADPQGVLGMVLPERGTPDADIPARFESIAAIAQRHLQASQACAVAPEDRPQHFIATARATLFSAYGDPAVAETEVQALANLGYNTMTDLPSVWANRFNVPYVGGADYRPPGIDGPAATADMLRQHYQGHAERVHNEYGSLDRLRCFAMSDEPAWCFPGTDAALNDDEDALQRFHAYLQSQRMTPKLLGKKSWDAVKLTPPPAANATLEERRLWYFTIRFADHDQNRAYGEAAAALREAFGDNVLAYTNWNNPGIVFSDLTRWGYPPVYMSHNWFDFSRARGATCLWLGPGNSEGGSWYRSTFRTWSLMLDLLRSAADQGVGKFGAYVHHDMIPDERGYEVALSIMAIAGRGGSGYDSYVWGPHYAFTEYMWSEKLGHYAPAADANRQIGRSEHLMHDAKAPQAEVALLWPFTSQLYDLNQLGYWTYNRDFMVEMQHIYFALTHNNIPVDFVDETMIQRGLTGYKVLYVVDPNLQASTVAALAAWVRAGGRLCASAAAGIKDEYNLPTAAFDRILGIQGRSLNRVAVDYSPKGGLRWLEPMGKVTLDANAGLGDGVFDAYGTRVQFRLAGGAVIGRFEDGSPAVVRTRLGAGETIYFAAMPGLAYSKGANERDGQPTIDYPQAVAQIITAVPDAVGVARPVTTSLPYVEALRLDAAQGVAVTLLNWSAQPIAQLDVTINGVQPGAAVRTASGAALTATQDGTALQVTLPMPTVTDVLLVEYPRGE